MVRKQKFSSDLKAMNAFDNDFCKGLKCKMCIETRFLIKNLDILLAISPVFSIFLYLC